MAEIARSATMASVSHAIDTIHDLGMKVLLKPMVDIADTSATWRAYADPSDKDQWFANYTNYIGSYADLAKAKGVELLSIGCEIDTLEQSANNAAGQLSSQPLAHAIPESSLTPLTRVR